MMKMKIAIVLLGIVFGYFFPKDSFSLLIFIVTTIFSFVLGYVFPDMMNQMSLSNRVDKEKVTIKSKISVHHMNTISFWIGVFIFSMAITTVMKEIIKNAEINQLGIIVLSLSIGIIIKLLKIKSTIGITKK